MAVSGDGRPDPVVQLRQLLKLRDTTRVELHRQLDDLLALPSQNAESAALDGTILDDIVAEAAQGFAIGVRIHTEHPQAAGRAEEDPSVTAQMATPKPLIEVVR